MVVIVNEAHTELFQPPRLGRGAGHDPLNNLEETADLAWKLGLKDIYDIKDTFNRAPRSSEEHTSCLAQPEHPLEQTSDGANTPEHSPNAPPQLTIYLQYRKRTISLLLIYAPLLVVSWILTCLLAGLPAPNGRIGQRHFPQSGPSAHGVYSMLSWVAAVRTPNSLPGLGL
ncbi:hypothetical protein PENCOP_c009G01967 [Penicillium coprophilum]|uniref:Uncharacterized protein n=1 Tax=Penicillium coprophilum TaxID=36646 RepID=A0A1V6UGY7_9EURO|nr:hypothetical protein PENCOP_c009G01967 [Penicillium coprophilum]